ncbi:hypothetical protein Tco_1052097 [Tanacetum coccineum]
MNSLTMEIPSLVFKISAENHTVRSVLITLFTVFFAVFVEITGIPFVGKRYLPTGDRPLTMRFRFAAGHAYMGLLDFIKSSDPSKTNHFVTHTIADEIDLHSGKNKRKVGATFVLPPVKKARTGGVSIKEPAVTTTGKSPAII